VIVIGLGDPLPFSLSVNVTVGMLPGAEPGEASTREVV
jgi:hypothetical protein